MEREWVAEESVVVAAGADQVYELVANVRRTGEWSPETFKVVVLRGRGDGPLAPGRKFIGFNRIGPRIWFTSCRVGTAEPGRVFAFRVSSFGFPVALWGFRIEDIGPGRTRLTQYWEDLRRGGGLRLRVFLLVARAFTGVRTEDRSELNRAGMRAGLERIKTILEQPSRASGG